MKRSEFLAQCSIVQLSVFGYDRSGGALYRSEVTVSGEKAA